MQRAARMSQTETKVVTPRQRKETLQITDLKTVKWVQSNPLVKRSYQFTSEKYSAVKCLSAFLAWILGSIEMVIISMYLFIHSLPWPDWVMKIILLMDEVIENILEAVSNKLEWWWDILMVRLMWFRDTVESMVDAFLSLCLFIVYKTIELWMWTAAVTINVLKFVFAPLIWVVTTIFPPPQKELNPPPAPPPVPPPMISALSVSPDCSTISGSKPGVMVSVPEPEDVGHLSGTTSDCESDVSVLSESWSIKQSDKSGLLYNRVEMKATAEGRLRAAMYKRVKTQLSLMRKNSVSFSRGMTSYARQYLEPKVVPIISVLTTWLRDLAAKYGLLDTFDRVAAWVKRHYLISSLVTLMLTVIMAPIEIISKILLGRKKKSRRTRSMRSESLRRRTGTVTPSVVSPPALESLGLIKSEEPVVLEEPEFCTLRRYDKLPQKGSEDDSMRDSALASSLDDLCHTSDSNDGSNSLKEQTIHEEDYKDKEIKPEMENIKTSEEETRDVLASNSSQNEKREFIRRKTSREERREFLARRISHEGSPVRWENRNGVIFPNSYRPEMHERRRRSAGIILLPGKYSSGNSSDNDLRIKATETSFIKVAQENNKQLNFKTFSTPNSIMKDSNADITKMEENEDNNVEESERKPKPQKRKISFSLDNVM